MGLQYRTCRIVWILSAVFVFAYTFTSLTALSGLLRPSTPSGSICRKPVNKTIPKHIHQTFDTHILPEKWRRNRDKCLQLNPTYNYTLWSKADIERFLESTYPWIMETYHSYRYEMQRFDVARYFILRHYGGIYMDLDIECLVAFDHMFHNMSKTENVVLVSTRPVGYNSYFMVSAVDHPFFTMATEDLFSTNYWYMTPYWTVMFASGPVFVWLTYRRYPCKEQIHTLPLDHYYIRHEAVGSWLQADGALFAWCGNNFRWILYLLFIGSLSVFVFFLYRRRNNNNNFIYKAYMNKHVNNTD